MAAVYPDALATHLHEFSDELNYPEAMRKSGGVSGGFDLSRYGFCVFIYAKPPMRRAFQFGITDMSRPGFWPPRRSLTHIYHGVSDLQGNGSPDSECLISICAAMFCTNHTIGPPRFLRSCSKVCYDSDNETVSARSDLVRDVSVVAPPLGSDGAHVARLTPSPNVIPRMSSAM